MSQAAQVADTGLVNTLSGYGAPVASAVGSPPTWFPGLIWYDTTNAVFKQWTGNAGVGGTGTWVSSPAPGTRYLALLTADPVFNAAVNPQDAGFAELTTAGYARQAVTFTAATTAQPSLASNTAVITFTMSSSMLVPVQWVALMTLSTTVVAGAPYGQFLASWNLSAPVQVNASQSIQIGIGQLVLQGQ